MKWILLCELSVVCLGSFTHDFAVEIDDDTDVDRIAAEHDFINLGKILPGYYHFQHKRIHRRSLVDFDELTGSPLADHAILSEPSVRSIEQQRVKNRVKRDYEFDQTPNDPLYKDMWYMDPNYQDRNSPKDLINGDIRHMNITGAWALGYTGKGVSVSILDDGIEWNHDDLKQNYDPAASYDVNDDDKDPMPHYNSGNDHIDFTDPSSYYYPNKAIKLTEDVQRYNKEINRHGTRCAGEVAAEWNNGICVPGIAFNAKIGGIRMLDGDVTDIVEAKSIGFAPEHVDIYSASWGPDDDGRTVDGPAKLARKAFETGALTGRDGLGSIFVWASGNGGRYQDNCNCDGYTNSVYTISISSTSETESIPWYSEACASTLASTYSSGTGSEKQIVTTDLRNICTERHTGTSASAPIAAAIVALALEANPQLTWRDMQHLVVQTSKRRKLQAADWRVNGVGRDYSHRYGYGLMDAGLLVEMAENWTTIPEQRNCTTKVIQNSSQYREIKGRTSVTVPFDIHSDCDQYVDRLEHVMVKLTLDFDRRGDLKISLTSPMGTESDILDRRPHDYSSRGFSEFEFLTVHMWDESPRVAGKQWTLKIENVGSNTQKGKLRLFELRLHGTGISQYPAKCTKNTVYNPIAHHCMEACPRGTYTEYVDQLAAVIDHRRDIKNENSNSIQDISTMNKCKPCDSSCDRCYGPTKNDCQVILSRGKDDITADDDYYNDIDFNRLRMHDTNVVKLSMIIIFSSLFVFVLLKFLQKSKRGTHRYTQQEFSGSRTALIHS